MEGQRKEGTWKKYKFSHDIAFWKFSELQTIVEEKSKSDV